MNVDENSSGQVIKNIKESDQQVFNSPIQVVEEQLRVEKQLIEVGKVKIKKRVFTEDYNAEVPVFKEEIIVEKKSVNQYIEGAIPSVRLDGDITIIPVIREVFVKRLLLVEELHITKRTIEYSVPIHETLRREEVFVDRVNEVSPLNEQISE